MNNDIKPQQNITTGIEAYECHDYFRSLLYSDQAPSIVINNNTDTINDDVMSFNEPFTLAEVEFQIGKLINNKSSGIYRIPAEFYKNYFLIKFLILVIFLKLGVRV